MTKNSKVKKPASPLMQVYVKPENKEVFSRFVKENFDGRLKSMSWQIWQLMELYLGTSSKLEVDLIQDEYSFRDQLVKTIRELSPEEVNNLLTYRPEHNKNKIL